MDRESVEVSGKSVDEAIDEALDELGLRRQQVEIEILTAGKAGLFGIGGEPARVRVTALEEGTAAPMSEPEAVVAVVEEGGEAEVKDADSPEVEEAAAHLTELLALMGVDGEVSVRAPETPGDGIGRASAVLDISGDDLGLLIGRRGATLAALQYLLNVLISRKIRSRLLVSVDVEHYRRRREETLRGLARRMADRVRQTGRSVTLEPMPAMERRIVHLALAEHGAVTTGSTGEGDARKVVIYPGRSPPGPAR